MTKSRIDEIEARANAATKGPWHATLSESEPDNKYPGLSEPGHSEHTVSPHEYVAGWRHDGGYGGYGITKPNAEFIAAAREDVPFLIAEVRNLQADNAAVRAALKHSVSMDADVVASLRRAGVNNHSPWAHLCVDQLAVERDALSARLHRAEELLGLAETYLRYACYGLLPQRIAAFLAGGTGDGTP